MNGARPTEVNASALEQRRTAGPGRDVQHVGAVDQVQWQLWVTGQPRGVIAEAVIDDDTDTLRSLHLSEVIADPHVAARHMLVEMERTDDGPDPVLIPGNPVKLSKVAEGPETRVPWVGEHTDDVLRAELGLDDTALADLRSDGVIN